MTTESPLIQWHAALQGLVAGGLVGSGLLAPLGGFQLILLAAGIVIFIDALIPNGQTSVLATILFAILGGLVSLAGVVTGTILFWAAAVTLVAALSYAPRMARRYIRAGKEQ
ncbi:MAG: hypothetical protein HY369_00695 [Candidatus Aenigmarchaeota archaeon]|nr:hypothetical protein [Candidatus Aenigmarchaeota archaeon]